MQGLRSLGFSAEIPLLRSLAMAARIPASYRSEVFQRCIKEFATFAASADAPLDCPLWFWVVDAMLVTTSALRDRELSNLRLGAALLRPRAQAELANVRARLEIALAASAALRRSASLWVEDAAVPMLVGSVFSFLRRTDIPEAVRFRVLHAVVNGWRTPGRFQQDIGGCLIGGGVEHGDTLEHYLFCDAVALPRASPSSA